MRDAWKRLQDPGAVVYGVNPSSKASHAKFADKLCLPFPLIVDKGGRMARAFKCGWGPLARRTVYIVGPGGRIVYSRRGMPAVAELLDAIQKASICE